MQSLRSRLASSEVRPWPDRPIPVSLVITDLDVGGAERALVALATKLDRSRWNPSVVCLGDEGALVSPLRAAGLTVTCLNVHRRRPAQAVFRLAGALRGLRPAMIQSFLFHANIAAKLAAPLAGRPWVIGGLRVAERAKRWHRRLDRWTLLLSAGSVCVSSRVRSFTLAQKQSTPDRLVVIPNGIEPAPQDSARPVGRGSLGLAESSRVLLFVGRITEQKALPLLLDAFETVAPNRPEWSLLIVGDGPDRPGLQARTEASPTLSSRVRWLGRREDVPSLMKAADLLVLPSLWEGMPNVVLEAMAAGRPVLVTDVEGIDDLVVAEGADRTGWVIPRNDRGALIASLLEATARTDLHERLGANGRALVERRFAMESVVASYDYLWAAVLGLERDASPPSTLGPAEVWVKSGHASGRRT